MPALNAPLESSPIDRTKNYGSEIEEALTKHHATEKTSLLEDIPQIEKTLSDEPLSLETREMVRYASEDTNYYEFSIVSTGMCPPLPPKK